MGRVAAIALLSVLIARAHEIGTTRVTASFDRGEYQIELITDAEALARKLAAAGSVAAPDTEPAMQALLQSSEELFRRRVELAFDGAAARPAIEYRVKSGAAEIRLTGRIPDGARQFTWSYGWTFASYSLTVRQGSTHWLEGNQTTAPISLGAGGRFSAGRYLLLGFTHIVPHGLDHMLFVLGIYLLSGRTRTVLYQVSAFTVAHSITLGLSMYGLVSVPARIVEPAIAISIGYVAIENIFLRQLRPWRVALVFAFGLLHGLGFAGSLQEIGLPRSEFLIALLTFNVGVEAGQLAVIGTAFLLLGWRFAGRKWYRSRIAVPASAMIACAAVYWTIQRLIA